MRIWMKRLSVTAVAGTAAVALAAAPAIATDSKGSDTVVTGAEAATRSAITMGNFTGVTLNGNHQTTTATLPSFNVTDATGTAAGWHVTIKAAQPAAVAGTGTDTLAAGLLTVSTKPSPTKVDNTSGNVPATIIPNDTAIDGLSAINLESAAADVNNGTNNHEGMGSYNTGATTLQIDLPAKAFAGTYSTTVTVDLVSGPTS